MNEKVSDEKLAEMLKHLDSVVGGPWVSIHHSGPGSEVRQADSDPTNKHHWPFRIARTIGGQIAQADRANFDHIARCDPDTIRSILTELKELRAQGGVRVAVKPLEWLSSDDPYFAQTPFCRYRISSVSDDTGSHWETTISYLGSTYQRRETEFEAKAAAFADYRTRVLSALETQAPVQQPRGFADVQEQRALETEAVEPVLWWVVETMPSGVKRWQCVEHKYDAHKRADDSPYPATATPLYAQPPHSSIPTVTGEMVERGRIAFVAASTWNKGWPDDREVIRKVIEAALSSESKP